MACVNGAKLNADAREQVLSTFGYRWTVENETRARRWCATGGIEPPTMPLVTDSEWLASYAFHVTKTGRLDTRRRYTLPACMADDWNR